MSIFSGSNLYEYFNKLCDAIERKIQSYDYRQLKNFSAVDIESIVNYYRLSNVSVDFDKATRRAKNGEDEIYNYNSQIFDDQPKYVNVKGKHITIFVPINGDWSLFKYSLGEQGFEMMNYYDENYKDIDITKDPSSNIHGLSFTIFITDNEIKNKTKDEIVNLIKSKEKSFVQTTLLKIHRLNSMINDFDNKLPSIVDNYIKTKINDDSSLELVSDAIGVEIHSKVSTQSEGSKIEILPKKADILLPDRKKYDGYYLDKNNYSAIISTIRNHLIATESNPRAIQELKNEELIRDTILWTLNANYFVATGETFRKNGKTDILISFKDKSVFVAECKIWKGKQYLEDGIDQMLGYTTWRDSKMAIIIFNLENVDYSHVCSEVKNSVKNHQLFKKFICEEEQGYFECEFIDKNNQGSVITVAVLCANYVERK